MHASFRLACEEAASAVAPNMGIEGGTLSDRALPNVVPVVGGKWLVPWQ